MAGDWEETTQRRQFYRDEWAKEQNSEHRNWRYGLLGLALLLGSGLTCHHQKTSTELAIEEVRASIPVCCEHGAVCVSTHPVEAVTK